MPVGVKKTRKLKISARPRPERIRRDLEGDSAPAKNQGGQMRASQPDQRAGQHVGWIMRADDQSRGENQQRRQIGQGKIAARQEKPERRGGGESGDRMPRRKARQNRRPGKQREVMRPELVDQCGTRPAKKMLQHLRGQA